MKKISAVINTKNAAGTLEKCLKSLDFVDEIVVVDMNSSDDTQKIAAQFTDKIFEHKDLGYADPARDWSINQASHDWILVLDADELVPAKLQVKIKQLLSQKNPADVYLLPRKNIIFDNWIKAAGWWPDYQPRLFKKDHVSWKVGVHRLPDTKGKVEKLAATEENALLHFNYQTVEDFVNRLNRYTSLQAKERQTPQGKFSTSQLLLTAQREFISRGFAKKGYQLGLHGISLAMLQAFYEAVIYLKQWQLAGFPQEKIDSVQLTYSFGQIKKELNYWLADYHCQQTSGLKKIYWRLRRKFKV